MISFSATILKFGKMGEKTGWTYILVPETISSKIFPGNKKSFRVKGKLDDVSIKNIALMPMGEGNFIMPLNATMRKHIKKQKGALLKITIELDKDLPKPSPKFSECLNEEPDAKEHFQNLPLSHRNYFIKWIGSAKTDVTKATRIAATIKALSNNIKFGEMLKTMKLEKEKFMK